MDSGCEIGLRISKLRVEQSQQEVANALKVRRETVTQWENGTRRIKDTDIVRMADYFGCSCDFILRGVDSKNLDVHRATGLSDETINSLRYYNDLRLQSEQVPSRNAFDNSFSLLNLIMTDAFFALLLCAYQIEISTEAMLIGNHFDKNEATLEELAGYLIDNESMKHRGRLVVEPDDMVTLRAQELADEVKKLVSKLYEQLLMKKRGSTEGGVVSVQSSENQ